MDPAQYSTDPAHAITPSARRDRHHDSILANIAERLLVYRAFSNVPHTDQAQLAAEHAERITLAVLGLTRGVR